MGLRFGPPVARRQRLSKDKARGAVIAPARAVSAAYVYAAFPAASACTSEARSALPPIAQSPPSNSLMRTHVTGRMFPPSTVTPLAANFGPNTLFPKHLHRPLTTTPFEKLTVTLSLTVFTIRRGRSLRSEKAESPSQRPLPGPRLTASRRFISQAAADGIPSERLIR